MKMTYFSKVKQRRVVTRTDAVTISYKGGSFSLYETANGKLRMDGLSYESGSAFKFVPISAHTVILEQYDCIYDVKEGSHRPITQNNR